MLILSLIKCGLTLFKHPPCAITDSALYASLPLQVSWGTSPSWSPGPCLMCWWRSMVGRTRTPVTLLTSSYPCWRWCLRRGPQPANASTTPGLTRSHKLIRRPPPPSSCPPPLPTVSPNITPWWQLVEPQCGEKLESRDDEKDVLPALSPDTHHIMLTWLGL